ncbi:MAG: aspartate kinase [Ignavibacteria bacterium]|jgi:aspartate kinase
MQNRRNIKVLKFGGDCLKDASHILKVVDIILSQKNFSIVIISAIHEITDLLINGITTAKEKEVNVANTISILTEKHYEIAQDSIVSDTILQTTIQNIVLLIKKVERLLYGISYTEEDTAAIRAYITSFGERLAAVILSGVLEDKGVKSNIIETDKIGLVTDEQYENATVDLKEFKVNFKPVAANILNDEAIPILTGFFGNAPDGKVTTFGRNGSDYTAAVMAYGFDAPLLEIWKDVDGFMNADPKIIKKSEIIDHLSYFEVAELCYYGDRLLHPLTIEPIAGLGIPVHIKNIFNTDSKGTIISPDAYIDECIIKSIAYNPNIAMIRLHGSGIGYKAGIVTTIANALSENNINIFSTVSSQTCINLLIETKDADESYEILKEYKGNIIERIDFQKDIALIAVVGEGVLKRKGIFARVLGAVSDNRINIEMASAGASEVAIYLIISSEDVADAVSAIHKEFFRK